MTKRVFIVHGWGGNPDEAWYPWMRKELVARAMRVTVPPMPDTDRPDIGLWLMYLKDIVEHCDDETFFVGQSLGCQAILRYLATELPGVCVGGCVFVAGFEHLGEKYAALPPQEKAIDAWLQEPIHWESIRGRSDHFSAIFSDNDPWVPLSNVDVFSRKLEAKTIVLHHRGHMGACDGNEHPEALAELLAMMKESS